MSLPLLQLGSNGLLVKELQKLLQKQGYNIGEYGVFGVETYEVILSVQAKSGLVEDGIVGIGTWYVLGANTSKLESLMEYPILQLGSKGRAVEKLQSLLRAEGYIQNIDGVFGFETLEAVLKLQSDKKIQTDGTVGAETWAKLMSQSVV